MGVMTQQLLQPHMGMRLPAGVRRSLISMGAACNECAVALQYAAAHSMRIESIVENHRVSEHAATPPLLDVITDLQRLADQHFEQAIVVLARAATGYAVYASQVAQAVAADQEPPPPGSAIILPSDVIAAWGHYLPEVRFGDDDGDDRMAAEQNTAIAEVRRELIELITYRMQSESAAAYDDIATVTVTVTDGVNRQVAFADTLHIYAGVLVWALGVFSGTAPDDRTDPRSC